MGATVALGCAIVTQTSGKLAVMPVNAIPALIRAPIVGGCADGQPPQLGNATTSTMMTGQVA
ncbi:hypothetical protein [Mycobacterium uberis]|uniref:hypothetical protein n=1 Tax=Mycobacterium uberis TaxID=2162698 RepID=UPI001FB2FB3F|nr:hypothetical protein [Mycobacterium uberis]